MAPQQEVPKDRPIQFGALLFDYQAIDVVGPLDLLNMCGQGVMGALRHFYITIPDATFSAAPSFEFHHISASTTGDLSPIPMLSSAFTFHPTSTVSTCPPLDYLLVGGPNPATFTIDPAHAEFIRKHVAAGKTLFTTCTGAYVVAASGALDGREATINNQEFHWVKERYPKVHWRKDKKWVIDEGKDGQGTIWTGSGAVAAMDMIAHWVLQEFGMAVLMQGCAGLDYEPRDIDGLSNEVLPKRLDESTGKILGAHVYA